jgi:hypothetical protein
MKREENKNTAQKDQTDQKPDENKRVPAPSERDTTATDPLRRATSIEDVIEEEK